MLPESLRCARQLRPGNLHLINGLFIAIEIVCRYLRLRADSES